MTEAEWLACSRPESMLGFLRRQPTGRGVATDRKRRLFAVACCRRIWHLIKEEPCRQAVEVAERYADGLATDKELRMAHYAARNLFQGAVHCPFNRDVDPAAALAAYFASGEAGMCVGTISNAAFAVGNQFPCEQRDAAWASEWAAQSDLVREVMGNPFRPIPRNPSWLLSNGGSIMRLAQEVYDQKRFEFLPVLADALMGAGCDEEEILAHCREPGPHARGCWVLDIILSTDR
jgi:hypothetical protein